MKSIYSSELEKELIKQVKLYPNNLTCAFRIVADKFNCHPSSVRSLWYGTATYKGKGLKYRHKCFCTISDKKILINGKHSGDDDVPQYNGLWTILKAVKIKSTKLFKELINNNQIKLNF